MTKPASLPTDARDNFHKLLAANKKAAQRNNVVLLEACLTGKLNYIKTSIDAGADVHHIAEDNTTPLTRCCQLSPAEAEKCVRYLVKRGADTNFQDKYGRTAISHMAEQGKELIVDILLNKCEADPTIEDVKGNTPLMYAVSSGNVSIVGNFIGYFLAIGFPIDKRNMVGNTPLLLAAKLGKFDIAKMLVELGNASLHLRDVDHFRSAIDWMRLAAPQHLKEFTDLDPILCRKRDSAKRRSSTTKPKYRVLSDFFLDGKMPSCWRSSSKGSQEPRKHTINRTICIVAEEDKSVVKEVPKLPDNISPDYENTIDSILSTLADTPLSNQSSAQYSDTPRSMFDIPTRDFRHQFQISCTESTGRFIDPRCDSQMSIVSAPSPTLPALLDDLHYPGDLVPTSPTPNLKNKRNANHRKMERRRSIDNSQLLMRHQISSPVVSSPIRRTSRTNTIPSTTDPKPAPRVPDPVTKSAPRAAPTTHTTLSSDSLRSATKITQRSESSILKEEVPRLVS